MKKICYVVTIPLTIRSFFIPQLQYISTNGYSVSVICSDDGNIKDELGENIRFIPLDIPRGISFFKSIKTIKELLRIFNREKFDVIQYSTPNASLYASIAAKMAKCKVRNYHLMGYRYLGVEGLFRRILKLIEKVTCYCSTSIECVSDSNLQLGISEKLFQPEQATVVWNGSSGGVELKRFNYNYRNQYRKEIRDKYNIGYNELVFGFVGRITRDKGINELLEAFQHIKNAKLLMVGMIDDADSLNQELYESSLHDETIIYTGNVDDVEKYYAAIDVLVLPSYREGFGNVVIEAGAMGTPAIVTNIPGPVDTIVQNETGLMVEEKNVKSLEGAMQRIFSLDYKAMGQKANEYIVRSFDSERLNTYILQRKNELLNELLGIAE